MKKTKIIATIGPACSDAKILQQMIESGMSAARLNFSHGTFETHGGNMELIRSVSKKLGVHIPIIQDLCGPKLRLGDFKEKTVKEGDKVLFGDKGIPVQKEIWKWFKTGQPVLIDDGVVELLATKVTAKGFEGTVVVPGVIKPKKGVSLPGIKVDLPSLSDKDLSDLKFGVENNVDYIALSFVKNAKDIVILRKEIKKHTDRHVRVIAKIETLDALKNLDGIIAETDAVMIARGDLALNIPQEMVPVYQKKISHDCQVAGVPVIVATQMLDSMINSPRPTRAEMSDVANAVVDLVDCVMLSGETAFGKYPVKVVETMTSLITQVEKTDLIERKKHVDHDHTESQYKSAVMANSLVRTSKDIHAKAIVVNSYEVAVAVSRFRPACPIVLISEDGSALRESNLVWGILPKSSHDEAKDVLKKLGLLKKGDKYVDASDVAFSGTVLTA